jgi:hypothetical protein
MEKESKKNKMQTEGKQTTKQSFWQSPQIFLYLSLGLLVLLLVAGSLWFWWRRSTTTFCQSDADCMVKANQCLHKNQQPAQTEMMWYWAEGEKCECVEGKCKKITCADQGLVRVQDSETGDFRCVQKKDSLTNERACVKDSDCVLVNKNCCGCSAGGSKTCINKDFYDQWQQRLDCKSKGTILCPQVYLCDSNPTRCECVDGICQGI